MTQKIPATVITGFLGVGKTTAIMHLLRNAVDHGLEATEQERVAAGKPPAGRIILEFSRVGDTVVVQCGDDGRGVDYEAIAAAAVDRGLVPPGVKLSTADLNALILTPGFSTRREVTQTSGRGVGLDVVNEQIRLLKGNLSISSQPGRGTTFTLVAPMSILSAHTLVVQMGEHRVSVISRALEQVIYLEQDRLEKRGGRLFSPLQGEDEPLPVCRLDDLIFMNTRRAERHTALMVLRNREGRRCGVLAETIRASEEQIIKPLSRTTHKVAGVVGATILGDGRVSPVIDLYELPGLAFVDSADESWRKRFAQRLRHLDDDLIKERPVALVVDDSLSARRSLAQFVGDMGMEVYTAKDGFEAIQIIQQRIPTVILVDLEIPRMYDAAFAYSGASGPVRLMLRDSPQGLEVFMVVRHQQIDPEGRAVRYAHYPAEHLSAGRLATVADAAGKEQHIAYPPRGEQRAVWGDNTQPLLFEYNDYCEQIAMRTFQTTPEGDPSHEEDKGAKTAWHYDEATGALLRKEYADGHGPVYVYTEAGQLKERQWAREEKRSAGIPARAGGQS